MKTFKEKLIQFLKEEDGLETVEYAVAGSLILAGSVAAFDGLGNAVIEEIQGLTNAITGDGGAGGGAGGAPAP